MNFIDSFKRLEKLCNEIYGDIHGVKKYIEEMSSIPMGARYVQGWDEYLKKLKHYNWVRNQISHEPGCSEANMCKPGDAEWICAFYSLIMEGEDPLTLYRKASSPKRKETQKQVSGVPIHNDYSQNRNVPQETMMSKILYLMILLIVLSVLTIIGCIYLLLK